jgi:hypothetical protein
MYQEYQMYNLYDDAHPLLNLAGRKNPPKLVHFVEMTSIQDGAEQLRARLQPKLGEVGEPTARIEQRALYP